MSVVNLRLLKRRLRVIDEEIYKYSWWPTYVTELQFERHSIERTIKNIEQEKENSA